METYVKCLTFTHGILSLSNLRSILLPTVLSLILQGCYLTLVYVLYRRILTKALLPFARTELLFTSPLFLDI
jgi:hypothetical protein